MKKVAAIAEVYNAQMAPHLYAGPVEWAANVHLAASIPNILMAETIETPFHAALIKNSIAVENGFITPPSAAGLGIEVDEDLARAHPYTGSGLHLEMQEWQCLPRRCACVRPVICVLGPRLFKRGPSGLEFREVYLLVFDRIEHDFL
jgi:hypothetical protein